MPNPRPYDAQDIAGSGEREQSSLLVAETEEPEVPAFPRPPHRRQPSLIQTPPNGAPRTPRTSNRVRFEVEERRSHETNGHARPSSIDSEEGLEEVDYILGGRRSSTGQRAPLLTDVEAPSVTAALEFNAEDLLESARPKSGMRSAFMNMANSIIGAGIIGIERDDTNILCWALTRSVRSAVCLSSGRYDDGNHITRSLDNHSMLFHQEFMNIALT